METFPSVNISNQKQTFLIDFNMKGLRKKKKLRSKSKQNKKGQNYVMVHLIVKKKNAVILLTTYACCKNVQRKYTMKIIIKKHYNKNSLFFFFRLYHQFVVDSWVFSCFNDFFLFSSIVAGARVNFDSWPFGFSFRFLSAPGLGSTSNQETRTSTQTGRKQQLLHLNFLENSTGIPRTWPYGQKRVERKKKNVIMTMAMAMAMWKTVKGQINSEIK